MKSFWLVSIFYLIAVILFSEENTDDSALKLDIDTAVAKAVEHNFSLMNNKLDNNNYLLTTLTSFNKLLPSIGINVNAGNNYSYSRTLYNQPGSYTVSESISNNLSAGFSTNLSFNTKTVFDIRQTVIDYRSGLITYQNALNKVKNDTKKFYYNLIILREYIDLQNNKVIIAKNRYDSTFINNSRMDSSEIDILQNEYDYKSNLYSLKQAEDNYAINIISLKQMLGITGNKEIELTSGIPEITPIDYGDFENQSIEKNLGLQALYQSLLSEMNICGGYIAGLTPSFSLSYSITSSFNKDPAYYYWFNDANNLWARSGSFSFSVSLPLDPLFPFSASQVSIVREQNNIKKIKNNLNDQKEKIKLSVAQIIIQLKETEENIDVLKTNVELADYTYHKIENLYNDGKKSELELRDADTTLYNAQIQLLTAKYNYLSNMIDLKNLLNNQEK